MTPYRRICRAAALAGQLHDELYAIAVQMSGTQDPQVPDSFREATSDSSEWRCENCGHDVFTAMRPGPNEKWLRRCDGCTAVWSEPKEEK